MVRTLWRLLQTQQGLLSIAVVLFYKLGEAFSDTMFKPFLLDSGIPKSDIARWTGVYHLQDIIIMVRTPDWLRFTYVF